MHYIPESSRALLEGDADGSGRSNGADPGFHVTSAPVYVLTSVVGLLLLVDVLAGATADPRLVAWRSLFGFRLALLAAVLGEREFSITLSKGCWPAELGPTWL